MPRLVCLSDTHLAHAQSPDFPVPEGDLLLHAGDATRRGTADEIRAFSDWFAAFPHRHKVFVAGNHDFGFETEPEVARAALDPSIHYLQDGGITLEGLRIWGSPWQPRFFDWAFNLSRGQPLADKWAQIPDDTDVLITHGPPMGVLDRTAVGVRAGCADLLAAVTGRVRPRVHLFGHIHEGHGTETRDGIQFVNASNCSLRYRLVQPAIVVDL